MCGSTHVGRSNRKQVAGSAATISMPRQAYDALASYSQKMEDAGVTVESMKKIGASAVNPDGTIDLVQLARAGRAVEMDKTYSTESGDEYLPNRAIEDVVAETEMPSRNFKRAAIAGGLLLGIGLAGSAAADMTYNSGTQTWSSLSYNSDMAYQLNVQGDELADLFGTGTMTLTNIGDETRDSYLIDEFVNAAMQLPSPWTSSFDLESNVMSIVGDLNPSYSQSINFTFDPTNVEFGVTDLQYFGPITSGTLPSIDTLTDTTVVPVPSAILLALVGGITSYRMLKEDKRKTRSIRVA